MYAPRKTRPSAVTKYATYLFVACIVIAVFAVLEFIFYTPPWSYVIGIITALFAVFAFIDGLGLFMGQSWALTIGGYNNRAWVQAPDVREYFGLPPAYPAYPSSAPATAPSSPTCPTCGQPLTYVQQYQRWYCDREQKYV
jgi:uncharacterized protein (DUF983 family)